MSAPSIDGVAESSSEVGRAVGRKIALRVIVLLFALYAFFALDRGNVGFAASKLNEHLGISAAVYGLGASLFTLSYLASQIPVVFAMKRLGASRAIGLVAMAFGSVSALTAFVWNDESFLAVRFMLGFAEAGFGSFVVYYINSIVPSSLRGRAISSTLVAVPITMIVAAPISGALLTLDIAGLHGWQWLFLAEGIPAVLLGLACFWLLPNRASEARFLNAEEREWLENNLAKTTRSETGRGDINNLGSALKTPAIWVLGATLFAQTLGTSVMLFWMPQMIEEISGGTSLAVGWLTAIPWIAFAAGMLALGRLADRIPDKVQALAIALVLGAVGFIIGGTGLSSAISFAGLVIGAFGVGAMMGVFWTVPMQLLRGSAVVGAFAVINVIGNSSGIVSHGLIGWMKDKTGDLSGALWALAAVLILAAILLTIYRRATIAAAAREEAA